MISILVFLFLKKRIKLCLEKMSQPVPKLTTLKIVKKLFIETARESTVHSLPQIFRRRNRWSKLFWVLSFLSFSALCSYMITKSFISYYSYEVVTKFETIYENPTLFPVVSFCNQNPFATASAFEYVKSFFDSNNLTDIQEFFSQNFSDLIMYSRYGVGVSLRNSNISDEVYTQIFLNNLNCSIFT